MELLLIRHALPVRQTGGPGGPDPELSEAGRAQAERLGGYLASEELHAVYSSPLQRAVQTAEPLAETRRIPVAVLPELAEWHDGTNEYVPIEELKAAGDPRWEELRDGAPQVGAEPFDSFATRIVEAITGLVAAHPAQRVAVVCHGMVINAFVADVLGLTITSGFFYPNYTSIHRVAAARSGARSIMTLNETAHLRGSGLPMGLFQR
jgi:probable phosphoglycerate mutase